MYCEISINFILVRIAVHCVAGLGRSSVVMTTVNCQMNYEDTIQCTRHK